MILIGFLEYPHSGISKPLIKLNDVCLKESQIMINIDARKIGKFYKYYFPSSKWYENW